MARKATLNIRVYFGGRASRTYWLECKEIRGIKVTPDLLAYVLRLIGSIVEINPGGDEGLGSEEQMWGSKLRVLNLWSS